jgi:cell division FtsZ-interacting protein ZapD
MTAKERANQQRKEYKEMTDIRSRIDCGGVTTYIERQRLYIWEKRKAKKSKAA